VRSGAMGERFVVLKLHALRKGFVWIVLPTAILVGYALVWGIYNAWIVPRQEQGWPYQKLARDIRSRTHMPVIFFRAESHVLATVDAVLEVLHRLTGSSWQRPSPETTVIDFAGGERLLAEHTEGLLGPATRGRGVRIMVTTSAGPSVSNRSTTPKTAGNSSAVPASASSTR